MADFKIAKVNIIFKYFWVELGIFLSLDYYKANTIQNLY